MKSSKLTKFLLAGGAVGAICTPGYAQDNPAEGADDSVIIVTANKRQENLQEVPAAISVISQEQLEVTGFSDITDISAIAPNLTISEGTTSPTTTVVAIRGIASGSDDQLTLDPAVAVYVDGIYLGRTAATAIPMHDVEAVEVLRGPQGTLSGRNSTGGAVSFRLRRPTDDFGLDVEAGYGNQDHRQALVRLNSGNLFDGNVRMSLTYAHKQNDGYVNNILTAGNNKDSGYTNSDSIRFALEADLGDTGSVYYSFDYADYDATPPANQLVVTSPTVQRYLDNSTTVAGCNLTPTFARQGSLCLDDSLPTTTEIYGHVLRFENDFGGVTLRSTSGWRSWRNDVPLNDFDGLGPITGPSFSNATLFNGIQPPALLAPFVGGLPAANFVSGLAVPTATTSLFSASNFRKQDQVSQEIEILSNNDGPFTWVVGGF